jgi:hypothetical protein
MTRAKKLLIVEPQMLHTFTTNAWKGPQSSQPRSTAGAHRIDRVEHRLVGRVERAKPPIRISPEARVGI